MQKKTVEDLDVAGKRVFLRVDFNVPMDKTGTITDDTRIRACLPTIKYLLEHGARVIICSHLGRPEGEVEESLRMGPVAERLSELLGKEVKALRESVGPDVEAAVAGMKKGDIVMLENIRFHPEEEANDPGFARALSQLADVFVNDAFGASHRAHASVVGIARYLPAVSGFLMKKEIETLSGALENPGRPFTAMVGGAKVSGKLPLLENIITRVDTLLIGGGMAATFLKSRGYGVGASTVEYDRVEYVNKLQQKAASLGVNLLLPRDLVIAHKLEAGSDIQVVPVTKVPEGWVIADIGPKTIEEFSRELERSKTIVWNGPLGVFEIPEFASGTRRIIELLASLQAVTIIGGGSTAEAVTEMGLAKRMYHISTGGGASLEFLAGKVLPGLVVLQDK